MRGFRDANCVYDNGLPDIFACSFRVTAVFADGQAREELLSTQFVRDEVGHLKEVVVMIHPIPS
jgi:hypothetical protein